MGTAALLVLKESNVDDGLAWPGIDQLSRSGRSSSVDGVVGAERSVCLGIAPPGLEGLRVCPGGGRNHAVKFTQRLSVWFCRPSHIP